MEKIFFKIILIHTFLEMASGVARREKKLVVSVCEEERRVDVSQQVAPAIFEICLKESGNERRASERRAC